jgi:hypothetical protein
MTAVSDQTVYHCYIFNLQITTCLYGYLYLSRMTPRACRLTTIDSFASKR